MPYKSKAQAAYLHIHKPKGVNLAEWDRASKGKRLPQHVSKPTSKVSKLTTKG